MSVSQGKHSEFLKWSCVLGPSTRVYINSLSFPSFFLFSLKASLRLSVQNQSGKGWCSFFSSLRNDGDDDGMFLPLSFRPSQDHTRHLFFSELFKNRPSERQCLPLCLPKTLIRLIVCPVLKHESVACCQHVPLCKHYQHTCLVCVSSKPSIPIYEYLRGPVCRFERVMKTSLWFLVFWSPFNINWRAGYPKLLITVKYVCAFLLFRNGTWLENVSPSFSLFKFLSTNPDVFRFAYLGS
jgi:hypothetical protein